MTRLTEAEEARGVFGYGGEHRWFDQPTVERILAERVAAALVERWADSWDVRPLIEQRIARTKAEALREAAHATLDMQYPTSADPDVWGAWLLDRAEHIEAHAAADQAAPSGEETP